MSENLLPITNLNDFIFCPVSIYFHAVDTDSEKMLSQETAQINGTASHSAVDAARYSDKKTVLQGVSVYCERYGLFGKIDVFDIEKGLLTERKKKIKQIFDGYVFQLYAQGFALEEMGYSVKSMRLYSMDDNTVYPVALPADNTPMLEKFENLIVAIRDFSFDGFRQSNPLKCQRCIYEPLCSFACREEEL